MKKIPLIFLTLSCICYYTTANADNSGKIYIDPTVAQSVIEKHFSNIASEYLNANADEAENDSILIDIVNAYNNMLKSNDGFVSVDGIISICQTAFQQLGLPENESYREKCMAFANDLINTQPKTDQGCPYKVTKVNGSQSKIKYTLPDDTGFIRYGGSMAWRFFNPGNLRGSHLQCTTIRTKPNGYFAVFPSAEIGKQALHELLSTNPMYLKSTVTQAIYKYAPPSENNTKLYLSRLKKAGVNINAKLTSLTDEEFEKLENMIITLEGWNMTGTETKF